MQSGIPGPEGSLGKWQWADINQGLTELALEHRGRLRAARPRLRARDRRTAPGSTASCAPGPTRSRAGPPTSSRTSSPSACSACRGCARRERHVLRPDRRAAGDQGDRPRVPRLALQIRADARAGRRRGRLRRRRLERDGRARLARLGAAGGVGRAGARHRRARGPLRGDGLRAGALAAASPTPWSASRSRAAAPTTSASATCGRWPPASAAARRPLWDAGSTATPGAFTMEAEPDGDGVVLDGERSSSPTPPAPTSSSSPPPTATATSSTPTPTG